MIRDLTMIFSVFISIASLSFGLYKNIEAGNAKGFAYEQAYRVMAAVNASSIGPAAKANILQSALATLGTPPPVIDLSRSSADAPDPAAVCTEAVVTSCLDMAASLASLNIACIRGSGDVAACGQASSLKADIDSAQCVTCFNR
jgi:hypothetical protein